MTARPPPSAQVERRAWVAALDYERSKLPIALGDARKALSWQVRASTGHRMVCGVATHIMACCGAASPHGVLVGGDHTRAYMCTCIPAALPRGLVMANDDARRGSTTSGTISSARRSAKGASARRATPSDLCTAGSRRVHSGWTPGRAERAVLYFPAIRIEQDDFLGFMSECEG
jgi:hypothetical protein